jgi:hypothetical protein
MMVRPRAPSSTRVGPHRNLERSATIPLPARILLVAAVVGLVGVVLFSATGGLARIAGAFGSAIGGVVGGLTATPIPSPTAVVVPDPPTIESPVEPYTNQPAIDLVVLVPSDVVGDKAARVRVYVAVGGKAPKRIAELPIGSTPRVVVPDVNLVAGGNDFSATLLAAGGESAASPIVTFVLDQTKPKVTISAPKDNATVNRATATITGKTQGRSSVLAHNLASGASVTVAATADGSFSLVIALATGTNEVQVQATDPAGNVGSAAVTIRRGTGKLTTSLGASKYTFSRAKLPEPLDLTATVTDPDGKPLAGVRVTFSVTLPGVRPITSDRTTDSNGRALFRTTVPKGAALGSGVASVLVTTADLGTASDRIGLTIAK